MLIKDKFIMPSVLQWYIGRTLNGVWLERFYDGEIQKYDEECGPIHLGFECGSVLTFFGQATFNEELTLLTQHELVPRFVMPDDEQVFRWEIVEMSRTFFESEEGVTFDGFDLLRDSFGVVAGITMRFSRGCVSFVSAFDEHYVYFGEDCLGYSKMKFEKVD